MVKLNINQRVRSFLSTKRILHKATNESPQEKTRRFWHFSKLERAVLAITITAILLVSAFGLLMDANQQVVDPQNYNPTATPTPDATISMNPSPSVTAKPQATLEPVQRAPWVPVVQGPQAPPTKGLVESDPRMSNTTWFSIAKNAWSFYSPGHGVDSTTGLPASSIGWNYFTDWDLGVYIQAIIDAQKIGLIKTDDDWGSHARLEKVIKFLETRELNGSIPYWFYGSDGKGYLTQPSADTADAGTLLASLNNVKAYDPSFSLRIDNFVYNRANASMPHNSNGRTDYESLVASLKTESINSTSIYAYYAASGFARFFPQQLAGAPDNILNNIKSAGTVTTYNSTLPKAKLLCEPLLYSVFNQRNNTNFNTYLLTLMNQTYSAHEAKYNATGQYIAFSEGIGPSGFIWEWVVQPNGNVWKIENSDSSYSNINPVVYNKVSLSFLALYNTTFAYNMTVYLEKLSPDPSAGYCAGADYNDSINLANVYPSVDSNTNGLILSAARYALSD